MDRIKRRELKDLSNEDLFSLFREYTKKAIEKDLKSIYEKEASLLDSKEPWVFQLEG
jgi:hypothetical protein